MYALPVWVFKPYLSCTGCGKGRLGGAAGGEIGGKKSGSGGRGGTKIFNIIAAFAKVYIRGCTVQPSRGVH